MRYEHVKPSFQQRCYQAFKFFFRLAGKADDMDKYFRIEKFGKTLHLLHFQQNGYSAAEQADFLKDQLIGVELETHAYCNRSCSFCPNAFLPRRDKTQVMPEEMFLKVMDELNGMEFAGDLRMQRYNEPLADPIIYERIRQARQRLPHADLSFHSNGDFVTLEALKKLDTAGLNNVYVSLYPDYKKKNLREQGNELCLAFLRKVGVSAEPITCKACLGRYRFHVGRLSVWVSGFDLIGSGTDRGGTLTELAGKIRRSPCLQPFSRLYIDWTGDVFPCCNLRTDFPGHRDYVLGNVKVSSLREVYFSAKANALRRHLAVVGEKAGVCRTCAFDVMCSNKSARKLLDKTLKEILQGRALSRFSDNRGPA